jgi:hypothetical protein
VTELVASSEPPRFIEQYNAYECRWPKAGVALGAILALDLQEFALGRNKLIGLSHYLSAAGAKRSE